MFDARLIQASLFKKILESIKDLVESANFDCSPSGISLQAMDSARVTLINLLLRNDGFDNFSCDRSISLGLSIGALSKVLKCAGNDDTLTLKARDEPDTLTLVFESPKHDRVSDFEIKLLELDQDQYGIKDSGYSVTIKMPSTELQRICRDLSALGEVVTISATKEGVKFSTTGEVGSGNITVRPTSDTSVPADESTTIDSKEPVTLNVALKFLGYFTKATPLSPIVTIKMSEGAPVVVEYTIEELGYLSFFLAPKLGD
ncbi:hypothetical protein SAMD00019534_115900 [Acytostelium subglobosum LB1]|uniref:hypothetical protein n=1 Tax=Acytostelium subglobosum LB1 TaxID=1410327 RepID=UPI000644C9ED|nr:hypothetical protein SAMD00019534_115900 [Acytostelium subglobosum LB1]GAM28414.1 hypothetical protein SAMD00019534_115900 [Acytostelium subglobosum LB1]|eukprot:XP_012748731.1 hypothetical protein SAMD00019534_115900 [Acytostelium subglobosum LB1]